MLERIPLRPLPALAAALVVLAAGLLSGGGPLPADAGEGDPFPSPFVGVGKLQVRKRPILGILELEHCDVDAGI